MPDGPQHVETPATHPVRLLHISDIHFGAEDTEALQAVETFIERAKPAAVLISGDITLDGRRREFAAARDWIWGLPAPVIATPGNHDTPVYNVGERVFSPFERYRRHLGEVDASEKLIELDGGRIRITGLNTARGMQVRRNWAEGVVGLDDLDEAVELLKGGPQDAWRILLCHHPLHTPDNANISVKTLRGAEALRRAAEGGIDAILTGHTHDAFAQPVLDEDGLPALVQLGAGTLSMRVRGSPASFSVIELDGERLTQDVVHAAGGALTLSRAYSAERGSRPASGTA